MDIEMNELSVDEVQFNHSFNQPTAFRVENLFLRKRASWAAGFEREWGRSQRPNRPAVICA